jgi:allantoin racemase
MIRLKVIIPNSGMDAPTLRDRERMLSAAVDHQTKISVDCIETGPAAVESAVDEILVGPEVVKEVLRAKEDSFDAVVIYCFSDPALHAARQAVDIPVVGPGEASLALARMVGYRFSVITTLAENVPRVEMMVHELGLDKLALASVRSLDMPVLDLRADPARTKAILMEVCTRAVEEDGAQMIILGCLGLAGYGECFQDTHRVPVIDAAFAAVGMAELLVKLKLSHSRLTFSHVPVGMAPRTYALGGIGREGRTRPMRGGKSKG